MKYAQQAAQPKWFQSKSGKEYYSATSGSHFHNEWYEFDSRQEALDYISTHFMSQTFLDQFILYEGEYYHISDVNWRDDNPIVKNATPADINEMMWAESVF